MNNTTPSIQLSDIAKSFENEGAWTDVLKKISLEIPHGAFVSLVGPSGCGKSTLLQIIARLQQADEGQLSFERDGEPIVPEIGFVFQDPTLLPWRDVVSNVFLPLELKGEKRQYWKDSLEATLDLVGLSTDDFRKTPAMLSGGMRMRVSLARALVNEPSVFLLDEPFAALDDILREQLNDELLRIWMERKCTTIFVTHNIHEAVFLSQRVLVMSRNPGQIVQNVAVPFDYPRSADLRSDEEFVRLTAEIRRTLAGVVGK